MDEWNQTRIGNDYKRRDRSNRTEKEHHLAAAEGHEAQAKRADRRGDHRAAEKHRSEAKRHRETARTRYFPI